MADRGSLALMFAMDVAQKDRPDGTATHHECSRRAEAFWRYAIVTDGRRVTDVTRIVFPLQTVIWIVGAFISTFGAFWLATSTIRSDVRDILTRMALQTEVDKANQKLQEERIGALKAAIETLQRQQTMQDLKIQNLKDTLISNGRSKP